MKKRRIGLLLSALMVMTMISGIYPVQAAGEKVLINDDYSTLTAGASVANLGWTEKDGETYGTLTSVEGALKLQGGTSATGSNKKGVNRSLEHYDRTFAASGTAEETRTAVRSSHLKGIYDVEFTAKFSSSKAGNGIWADVNGYRDASALTSVGRVAVASGGFSVYNNKLTNTSNSRAVIYTDIGTYHKVRLRLNTNTGTYQIFLDDNTVASMATGTEKDTFPMTSWGAPTAVHYIADSFYMFADAANATAELKTFKVSEVEKDTDNAVEKALAALTIDKLTASPSNVTEAISLPNAIEGIDGLETVTWTSSKPEVISADGQTVVRQSTDTDVILTAKITESEHSFTKYKEFKLTVPATSSEKQWNLKAWMHFDKNTPDAILQKQDSYPNMIIEKTDDGVVLSQAATTQRADLYIPLKESAAADAAAVTLNDGRYYLEVTYRLDDLTKGKVSSIVRGNSAAGANSAGNGPALNHTAGKITDVDGLVTATADLVQGETATYGLELDLDGTNKGYFKLYADGKLVGNETTTQWKWSAAAVDTLAIMLDNYTDGKLTLQEIKAWKYEEGTTAIMPTYTPRPTVTPESKPLTGLGTVIYEQDFSQPEIDAETHMASGWIVSEDMQSMTTHTAEDSALKITKTAEAGSGNAESLSMHFPLKIYTTPYDAATHSAVYTDELFGKYHLELNVKTHITGSQLAAVGFSKKSGETLAKGAAVSMKKSQADVWIATGDTRVIETDGTPNDKESQLIYSLDTNTTDQWKVRYGDLAQKTLDQNWGGLAGIYLAMKPSNSANEYMMIRSARIYEEEKYTVSEETALDTALAALTIADLTETPDAVTANLNSLPDTAGDKSVVWTSNLPNVISDSGVVTRPVGDDVNVVLTAKVSGSVMSKYKEFYVTVKGETDPQQVLRAAAEKLTKTDLTDESTDNISKNLKTLPSKGAYNTTITWKSSDTTVMADDGTLVKMGSNAKLPVTMTATLSYGGATLDKMFDLQIAIDFTQGLYTLYETDFTGTEIADTVTQSAGVGTIRQENGKLLLDRTGTNGGTATTVRIYPALDDTALKVTGEMILEAEMRLPADCEKAEFIPYDSSGNRIFTIYTGKGSGGHGYTYVCRTTETGDAVHTRVEATTSDLTLKIKARINLDTKRLTLQVDDNDGSGWKTLADNQYIREDATNLSYIEINGVDNGNYTNTGIVEIGGVKVTVNKGYVPQYIVDSVDYYSPVTKLKGYVSGDIALVTKALTGTKVTWSTSRPEVLANDGKLQEITQDEGNIVLTFRLEMADDPTIYAEKVFDPLTAIYIPKGNLAVGATAKSNVSSKNGCGAENAIDGNVGTNWETMKWTNASDPALTVDFGKLQVFNQIMLKEAMISDTYPLRGFVIETSTDGKTYTELTSGTTLGENVQYLSVKETLARYIRFRVTKKVATSNVGLAELQVFLSGGEAAQVQADLLILQYQLGNLKGLSANVELPQTGVLYGTKFVYTSSDTGVFANDGTVIRPSNTTAGTLTVTAYAKTGEDAGTPVYKTEKTAEVGYAFSVLGSVGGNGGTIIGGGGGSKGGSVGAALPTGAAVNSDLGNESGSESTGSFRDVPGNHWAYHYIETLKSRRIIGGDENGNFNPEAQVTREEFLKMLMNALQISIGNSNAPQFEDVSESDWFYEYVAKGVELGIVTGISDTAFGAGNRITREDMTVLCVRAAEIAKRILAQTETEKTFSDTEQISAYARESVRAMQQSGIIGGYADGSFGPKQFATRAEAAKIICAMMD